MWRTRIAKIAGYTVALSGLLVVIGWLVGIDLLKTFSAHGNSMKFLTAICFVLSGIMLVLIVKSANNKDPSGFIAIILSILSLTIMLIMATLFFSAIVGFDFGVANALVKEEPEQIGTAYSVGLGLPSMATMICFILIALAGLLETFTYYRQKSFLLSLIGVLVTVIGAIALIGYSVNIPLLFYYIPDKSSAIAINAALLFVIWGLGVLFCYGGGNDPN